MTLRAPVRRSRAVAVAAAGMLAMAGSVLTAAPAGAAPPGCDNRNNNTVEKLLECVTVEGVRAHQQALQGIADANGGNRASGAPGYDASAAYVADQARSAGLTVSTQEFDFLFFQIFEEALQRTAPEPPRAYVSGTDFRTMTFSGSGDATATAVPVDPGPTSGCEAADFAGFPADAVALISRGTCSFLVKATNAEAAGASGAIIFNDGAAPDRVGLLNGTLGESGVGIPVVGTSLEVGQSLATTPAATVRLLSRSVTEPRTTTNVIAEIIGGRTANNVVMVGAHLDSVIAGPGIQDNGSGSAAILEVAKLMAKAKPTNTVRFAWWGAEELGLIGSQFYVDSLSEAELGRIGLYLNFDMVGSPNFARFVYDGDQSTFPEDLVPIPPGSAEIEDVFEKFYADRGLAFEDTAFDGRSDYEAFALADIPAGGLFTGAEGVKSAAQAARYGGTAGLAFDPNYHQAGDTFDNVSLEVLDQNADAIAYATLTLAYSTELVNGEPGRTSPGSNRAAGHLEDAAS